MENDGKHTSLEYMSLADYVLERLSSICNIEVPEHRNNYPDFFRFIKTFVERGDIADIERAAKFTPQRYGKDGSLIIRIKTTES